MTADERQKRKSKLLEPGIVAEIKRLMDQKGLKIYPLAKTVGIAGSHFHRMLNLKRGWSLDDLKKVADALDVPMGHFFSQVKVPIVCYIGREKSQVKGEDYIVIPEIAGFKPWELGGIVLCDNRFFPWGMKEGTKIVLADNQPITDGDFVLYTDQRGAQFFGRYQSQNGDAAIQAFDHEGNLKQIIIHASHKRLLQKVIATYRI